jgi:hypothetical protein
MFVAAAAAMKTRRWYNLRRRWRRPYCHVWRPIVVVAAAAAVDAFAQRLL